MLEVLDPRDVQAGRAATPLSQTVTGCLVPGANGCSAGPRAAGSGRVHLAQVAQNSTFSPKMPVSGTLMYLHKFCSCLTPGKVLFVISFISRVCFYKGEEKKRGVTDWVHFSPSGFNKDLVTNSKADTRCTSPSFSLGWGEFPCSQINFQNFLISLSAPRATYFLNNLKWQLWNTFKVQVLFIRPELCLSELCGSANKVQNSMPAGLNQASKPFIMHMLKPWQSFKQTFLFWTVSITSHVIKGWNNFCHWLATLVYGNKTKSAVSCMK